MSSSTCLGLRLCAPTLALIAALAFPPFVVSAGAQSCPGDCDMNGEVSIGELIRGVNISLGLAPLEDCEAMDSNGNGSVDISDLIRAVTSALNGCPSNPSPTATQADTPSATITNTASATPTITDTPTVTATPTSTSTPTVTPTATPTFTPTSTPTPTIPPLQLGIEVNPAPPVPGELMQVVLSLANASAVPFTNVNLSLVIPAGLAPFAAAFAEGGGCQAVNCSPGSTLSWTFPNIAPGTGVSVSFPATVAAATQAGTEIRFEARAMASGAPQASLLRTVVVAADRVLDLGLDEDRDPAAPGDALTYTLTFGNRSAALAQMTELRLPLPPGTSFVEASGAPTVANGVVTWALGTLAPGQGGTQHVTVQIDDGVALGEVLAAQAEIGPAAQPSTARASAATRVESGAPITLQAEINPDPVRPGELFQAVLSLANRQLVDTTAQLTLRVPAQVAVFAAAFTEGGGCFGSINCAAPNHVAWQFEDVAAGTGRSVSIMPSLAMTVPNGTVVPFEILLTESSGQWRRLRRSVLVEDGRNLDLGLDEDHDPAAPGDDLTYTLTFGNRSAALAEMTELRLPLPPGTSFVAASGSPTVANGVVTWSVGTLAPGEGGTQHVTVQIDDSVPLGEVLRAQAEIGQAGVQTNPTRASAATPTRASAATRIESAAPVALAAEINPDPVRPGEALQAVLSLTNRQLVASTAQLTLRVPAQVAIFAAAFTEGGGCFGSINCIAPNHVAWEFEDVGPGTGRSVSIMPSLAMVPNGTVVPFEILLTESSGQWRRLRRSVLVEDGRNLNLGLDEDRDPAAPGQALTYTLTFGNRSAALAEMTELRLPLPAGTTFVDASGSPTVADGVITWAVGTLAPGQGGTQHVTVQIDDGVALGDMLVAQAEIGEAGMETNPTRATAVTRVESAVPIALEAEINPDPVRPGELFQAVLSIGNQQLVNTTADLTLRVPAQVAIFAAAFTEGGACFGSINCVAPNHVAWTFADVGPGAGRTVSIMPAPANVPDGTVVPFEILVTESSGQWRRLRRSVLVEDGRNLDLGLDEDLDPVAPGNELTYSLTFGNRSAALAEMTVLRLPLPPGTSFVDATGSPSVADGVVTWMVGTLSPGQGGTQEVTVQVDSDLPLGEVLRAQADIGQGASAINTTRAAAATRIESGVPATMSMEINPDPVAQGQMLAVVLSAQNTAAVNANFALMLRVPEQVLTFPAAQTGGGSCFGSINCAAPNHVAWQFAMVPTTAEVSVQIPPTVAGVAVTPDGTVIPFDSVLMESSGRWRRLRKSVLVQ